MTPAAKFPAILALGRALLALPLIALASAVFAASTPAPAAQPVAQTAALTQSTSPNANAIALPQPQMQGGKPLMDSLRERQSTRVFSRQPLSTHTLSNLLWAAWGVNRPATGGRTAASALKSYEIDVYAVLPQGAFLYDALRHALLPVTPRDLSPLAATSRDFREAPLTLVYVADAARQTKVPAARQAVYAAVHAGFIGQNVYLFCASEGLGSVFREGFDRSALAKALGLRPEQSVVFVQTIGYPRQP